MFKLFNFFTILRYIMQFVLLTICVSCIGQKHEDPANVGSKVSDWKIPCDLSSLCSKKQLLSSLNGTLEFRKELKLVIDKDFLRFKKAYQDDIYFVCAKLISVGGCKDIDVQNLHLEGLNLYIKGLANCHHRLCHDYFEENRKLLLKQIQNLKSQESLKSYYLMAVKLPLPWYEKAEDLKKYLEIIDGETLEYEDLGPLISAIPNHQGLKTYISKRFFKIDEHLDGIAVYLARYQHGWHDIYYKKFIESDNEEAISAFINSMPVGCPRLGTILVFKDYMKSEKQKVLEETLDQMELDKYFSEMKLKSNKDSKCLSSSRPAF